MNQAVNPVRGIFRMGLLIMQPSCSDLERRWYAVFTLPQNEKSVEKHLSLREIESFLPTYQARHLWKNRQHVKVILPLFPTYIFVHIDRSERGKVLQAPGVLRIVGSNCQGIPIMDAEIDFLRSDFCRQKAEPYRDLVIGQTVRVRSGLMEGVQGVLIRQNNSFRFILTLGSIGQHASIEVRAEDLEPLCA